MRILTDFMVTILAFSVEHFSELTAQPLSSDVAICNDSVPEPDDEKQVKPIVANLKRVLGTSRSVCRADGTY